MRGTFARTLADLADQDRRILLLTADLGYLALEPFSDRHPDRFINAGVAEQNMVGVATGLAEAGFLPFVYSIIPFAVLRSYEFIRNGPGLHRLPVRVVGVGSGFEYGHNGPSHFGIEDVGVMRLQPNIAVIAPADYRQAKAAILATWNLDAPVYYRLGKDDQTEIPGLEGRFDLGRTQRILEGEELVIFSTGAITKEAIAAADLLAERGISAEVVVVAALSPAPTEDLLATLRRHRTAITVEAHYATGGLGSIVAEVIADHGLPCRLSRHGIRNTPSGETGSEQYLNRANGLDRDSLVKSALSAIRAKSSRSAVVGS